MPHGDRMRAYGQEICDITEQVQHNGHRSTLSIHQYMPEITANNLGWYWFRPWTAFPTAQTTTEFSTGGRYYSLFSSRPCNKI